MAEAVRLLVGKGGFLDPHQLHPYQAGEPLWGTSSRNGSGTSAVTAPRWNVVPSTAARSMTVRSSAPRPSRRAASTGLDGGWHRKVPKVARRRPAALRALQEPVVDQLGEQLLHEERVPLGGLADVGPELRRQVGATEEAGHQLLALHLGERLELDGGRPALPPPHSGRVSNSSTRATAISRIGASRVQSAMCSTRSRKVGSPQWMSSSTSTRGRRRARASKVLRTAQNSSSWSCASAFMPSRLPTAADQAIRLGLVVQESRKPGPRTRLRRDLRNAVAERLGHRPVGDAAPVGEAAAGSDRRLVAQADDELVDQARLADARHPEHREEMATPARPRPR